MADRRRKVVFAYPGDLDTPTGGYRYDRRICLELEAFGWHVSRLSLGSGFPFPDRAVLVSVEKLLSDLPVGSQVVVDGLAFGAFGDMAGRLSRRLDIVALVHHPLCLENGLSSSQAEMLRDSESRALAHADQVIVTSVATAREVAKTFGYAPEKISVVVPGTEKPGVAPPRNNHPLRLLSVGTVVPRKGYRELFRALGALLDQPWSLDIVGGLDADPACYRELRSLADALHLTDRIRFHGAVPETELAEHYRSADVFVLASHYEGYGMAYTEALAYGLPVIGSGGGAVRDTLPEGAAIYCQPGDPVALRLALGSLLSDPARRQELADNARRAAQDLPDWPRSARNFAGVLTRMREGAVP